jgi:hypothetical protein
MNTFARVRPKTQILDNSNIFHINSQEIENLLEKSLSNIF